MAQLTYRANLKSASFPFLTELGGRTVIIKGSDHTQVPGLTEKQSLTESDQSIGVPQLLYCHNVLPTAHGYKSVGYDTYTTEPVAETNDFKQVIHVRDGLGNTMLLGVTGLGKLYRLMSGETVWKSIPGAPDTSLVQGRRITAAQVSGVTYIYFANLGCYFFNFQAEVMVAVTLQGIDATKLLGLVAVYGYLIAYSEDSVVWSSTIDPTDFVPSLSSGAGGGQVEGARGKIVGVQLIYGAFIVFTDSNAIAAQFSSNIRFPFNYTEVAGCGGLYDPDYVTYDSGSGAVYAYTTSGFQSITVRQGTVIYPEVTDYLSGSYFEDFDESTDTFSITTPGTPANKQITTVADRYVVISYGFSGADYSHALVFDTSMKQWSRLKLPHKQCFEMLLYAQDTEETPRHSMAFLQADGHIVVANFDIHCPNSNGVAIFGKYQHVRARLLTIQSVSVEGVKSADTFTCKLITYLDGNTPDTPTPLIAAYSAVNARKYNARRTGINHSILLSGKFNLVSLIFSYTNHGGR